MVRKAQSGLIPVEEYNNNKNESLNLFATLSAFLVWGFMRRHGNPHISRWHLIRMQRAPLSSPSALMWDVKLCGCKRQMCNPISTGFVWINALIKFKYPGWFGAEKKINKVVWSKQVRQIWIKYKLVPIKINNIFSLAFCRSVGL